MSSTPVSVPMALSEAPSRITKIRIASTPTIESRNQGRGLSRDGQGRFPKSQSAERRIRRREEKLRRIQKRFKTRSKGSKSCRTANMKRQRVPESGCSERERAAARARIHSRDRKKVGVRRSQWTSWDIGMKKVFQVGWGIASQSFIS